MAWKLVFEPLAGSFELRNIKPPEEGGGKVTAGVLSLPSGTEVEFTGVLIVESNGDVIVEETSEARVSQ